MIFICILPIVLQCDFIAMQPCILRMTALRIKVI
ncbi:hypothetical protein AX23_10155 [Brucella melitensis 548]|nr:hypothetical protein AX23_10155 [Brucella melitensis 548]